MRTVHCVFAFIAFAILPLPVFGARPAVTQVALRKEGDQFYLIANGGRMLLYSFSKTLLQPHVALPNGDNVRLTQTEKPAVIVHTKSGQTTTISLDDTLKQWVNDDSKWNGHPFKNFILGVYNNEQLSVNLGDAVLCHGKLLAIMTTNSVRGSGNAIKSQQLIRIDTTPTPTVRMLRWLVANSDSGSITRLSICADRLLLFALPGRISEFPSPQSNKELEAGGLFDIDVDGQIVGVVPNIAPPLFPVGVLSNRWLVLARVGEKGKASPSIWLYDCRSRRLTSMHAKVNYGGPGVPESGTLMPYIYTNAGAVILYHLPDGKRISLPPRNGSNFTVRLWNGLVVEEDVSRRQVRIYSPDAGKLIKTFKIK